MNGTGHDRRDSFRFFIEKYKRFNGYEERKENASTYKSYLMICLVISTITLITACSHQCPNQVCIIDGHDKRECIREPSRIIFSNGNPNVHVSIPQVNPMDLDETFIEKEIILYGGWSSINTFMHIISCGSCIFVIAVVKNRIGLIGGIYWSISSFLFLVSFVIDALTLQSWMYDCELMGFLLSQEYLLNKKSNEIISHCHVIHHGIFFILFLLTGCMALGSAIYSFIKSKKTNIQLMQQSV